MKTVRVKNLVGSVLLAGAIGLSAGVAQAQTAKHPVNTTDTLKELAEILGAVHSIRGKCASGEKLLWRDRMMALIRHESPSKDRRDQLVERFNASFNKHRTEYPSCSRESMGRASSLATRGQTLVQSLSQSL